MSQAIFFSSMVKNLPDSDYLSTQLDSDGYALAPAVLSAEQCEEIAGMYHAPEVQFRTRINMARYNFGRGEYQYFSYPLPERIQSLRQSLYTLLAPIANSWHERLNISSRWPTELEDLLQQCHHAGQLRSTPLLLKYGSDDYNCLHQDLYGEIHFPLQVIIQLSQPKVDFEGGELMLVEQRPRMQSRGMVVPCRQGDAVVIPVRERPRKGTRGYHRVAIRHGVSKVTSGERYTLGLIFHDAK